MTGKKTTSKKKSLKSETDNTISDLSIESRINYTPTVHDKLLITFSAVETPLADNTPSRQNILTNNGSKRTNSKNKTQNKEQNKTLQTQKFPTNSKLKSSKQTSSKQTNSKRTNSKQTSSKQTSSNHERALRTGLKRILLEELTLPSLAVKTPRMSDGVPNMVTGNVVITPGLQRLVQNKELLERHPRRNEISDILSSDNQKAMWDYTVKNTEYKLDQMLQRIRRKIVYIVSYRKHQLENSWVGIDGVFNKYITMHPERPLYSCKSMLKLIRWCRYFDREYKPIDNRPYNLGKRPGDEHKPDVSNQLQLIPKLKSNTISDKCFICHDDDMCELDGGVAYCQQCLFRKYLFLYGANLICWTCENPLVENTYEHWSGKNWCKRCLTMYCFQNRLVVIG